MPRLVKPSDYVLQAVMDKKFISFHGNDDFARAILRMNPSRGLCSTTNTF